VFHLKHPVQGPRFRLNGSYNDRFGIEPLPVGQAARIPSSHNHIAIREEDRVMRVLGSLRLPQKARDVDHRDNLIILIQNFDGTSKVGNNSTAFLLWVDANVARKSAITVDLYSNLSGEWGSISKYSMRLLARSLTPICSLRGSQVHP